MAEQPILVPEKAMVFIDAMNLYESLQGIGVDTKLDYYKFSLKLVGPQRRLIRANVYTGAYDQVREPEKYAQQMKFFNKVHRMSFVSLKTRPLIARGGTYLQKGVDTLIATDMVAMVFLGHYDVAFLVSCDGDLAPAADAVKAARSKPGCIPGPGRFAGVESLPHRQAEMLSSISDLRPRSF